MVLELIAPKLQLVEEELQRNFESQIKTISDVGKHILAGGGGRPTKRDRRAREALRENTEGL